MQSVESITGGVAVPPVVRRAHCGPAAFAGRAQIDYRSLGFDPQRVYVRSCDEQGDRALAPVVLVGADGRRQRAKDAVALRQGSSGWGVILSPTFGR